MQFHLRYSCYFNSQAFLGSFCSLELKTNRFKSSVTKSQPHLCDTVISKRLESITKKVEYDIHYDICIESSVIKWQSANPR